MGHCRTTKRISTKLSIKHPWTTVEPQSEFQPNSTQNIYGPLQNHRANFNQSQHKTSMSTSTTTEAISTKLSTKHPLTTAEKQSEYQPNLAHIIHEHLHNHRSSEFQPNLAQSIQRRLQNHRTNFNQTWHKAPLADGEIKLSFIQNEEHFFQNIWVFFLLVQTCLYLVTFKTKIR